MKALLTQTTFICCCTISRPHLCAVTFRPPLFLAVLTGLPSPDRRSSSLSGPRQFPSPVYYGCLLRSFLSLDSVASVL